MFAVEKVLISDALLDAPFACQLGACQGACCVQGDAGAPLEPEERVQLERALSVVRKDLRPEARAVIDREGAWEETAPGRYATTCVDGAECVFVTYEGLVAKCAIQKAHAEGRLAFPKPISCHLFPVRVQDYGDYEALDYERIGLCDPARRHGCRSGVQLSDFLREPLVRKYGAAWYEAFQTTCRERRQALGLAQDDEDGTIGDVYA